MTRFVKAERKELKARIGLSGPSGSGKTYSALSIAQGLGNNIALIDTENKSARLYADDFDFMWAPLDPPFSPARYVEAMQDAVKEGADVLIIDSVTHSWSGQGGVLDIVNAQGGRFQDWQKGSPLWQMLLDAIIRCPIHIIVTTRAKTAYEVSSGGKNVEKIGLAPEARSGLEFEFTIFGEVSLAHQLSISKSRMKELQDAVIMRPSAELGQQIAKWLDSGKPDDKPDTWEPTFTLEMLIAHYGEAVVKLGVNTILERNGVDGRVQTVEQIEAMHLVPMQIAELHQVIKDSPEPGHASTQTDDEAGSSDPASGDSTEEGVGSDITSDAQPAPSEVDPQVALDRAKKKATPKNKDKDDKRGGGDGPEPSPGTSAEAPSSLLPDDGESTTQGAAAK